MPQAAQSQLLMWQMLQPSNHLHDPSPDSHVHVSHVPGNPELGAAPIHLSKAEQRGVITCPNLQAILCLGQPRGLVAALAIMAHCWLWSISCPAEHPGPFLEDALLCQSLVCAGAWGCSLPRAGLCTTLCWASFLVSPFIQLLKIPLNGDTITWFINNSQFCIQDLKENSGGTAQPTKMFPSIPKPTSPGSLGSCLSEGITTLLSQTQMTCTQQVKDLSFSGTEFQGMAVISPFCTWLLEHTKFSASPHKSSSAKQPSQHQGHSASTCSARCRQCSSPNTAHSCEHILKCSPCEPLTTFSGRLHTYKLSWEQLLHFKTAPW